MRLELIEETALAMAQASIQIALADARITRTELARRMGCPRSYITKMMQGDHNMTIKTLARALGACGKVMTFSVAETREVWNTRVSAKS